MRVTRASEAQSYDAKGHFDVSGLRLQGDGGTGAEQLSISLSQFLPGGGAERSASATDKYYVVLEGEIIVTTDDGDHTLGPLDSCYIAAGEPRSIINRRNVVTKMLVVVAAQKTPS